ncbi:MAG: hypothetical protein KatS3mg002_0417 [Candidatus Woesearchaeota archaeon]|nr:MAG: hypothetical protein KatS3mg002_0417 [Candidatus Woesearchaeota archaeon]
MKSIAIDSMIAARIARRWSDYGYIDIPEVILRTGAVLIRDYEGQWFLSSYTEDERDIIPILRDSGL